MSEVQIFKALADPTRYAVFSKLSAGSFNATQLREGLGISQPATSQHLSVLQEAGLVIAQKQGRSVNYSVDPDGLAAIAGWLEKYKSFWPQRIDRLKLVLKEMDDE